MKKVLKFIACVLVLLVVLFIINNVRNNTILEKWKNASENIKENGLENYYYETKINLGVKNKFFMKVYYLDGIYRVVSLSFDELEILEYDENGNVLLNKGELTEEEIIFLKDDVKKEKSAFFEEISEDEYKQKKKDYMFKRIKLFGDYYIVEHGSWDYYINKESGIVEKKVAESAEVIFKTDVVIIDDFDYVN